MRSHSVALVALAMFAGQAAGYKYQHCMTSATCGPGTQCYQLTTALPEGFRAMCMPRCNAQHWDCALRAGGVPPQMTMPPAPVQTMPPAPIQTMPPAPVQTMPPAPVPPSNCAGFYCEDFEGLPLGPLAAGTRGMDPERTVNIINDPVRGMVLQAQPTRGYNGKAGFFLKNFQAPGNSFFGRMYVKVDQFANVDNDHWVLVEATGSGSSANARPVGGQFKKWAPGSDGDASGDWTDHDFSQAYTQDGVWTCVEWQLDGPSNGMLLWADGVQVTPRAHSGFTLPTMNKLWFGWVVYQNDGRQPSAFDVRFDDVVLSTERVGCGGQKN